MKERMLTSYRLPMWGGGHHVRRSYSLQHSPSLEKAFTPNAHAIKIDMIRLDIEILEKFSDNHTLVEELPKLYGLRAFLEKH